MRSWVVLLGDEQCMECYIKFSMRHFWNYTFKKARVWMITVNCDSILCYPIPSLIWLAIMLFLAVSDSLFWNTQGHMSQAHQILILHSADVVISVEVGLWPTQRLWFLHWSSHVDVGLFPLRFLKQMIQAWSCGQPDSLAAWKREENEVTTQRRLSWDLGGGWRQRLDDMISTWAWNQILPRTSVSLLLPLP